MCYITNKGVGYYKRNLNLRSSAHQVWQPSDNLSDQEIEGNIRIIFSGTDSNPNRELKKNVSEKR